MTKARQQHQLDASKFKGGCAKPEGQPHLGDAIEAWDNILNDEGHTHYLILCYDDEKEKVEVFAKGGDYGTLSSREECLNRVKELYNQDIPCWGSYSFRGVKNDNPGDKDHDMHYAAFLLWPQNHHIQKHLYQGIQHIKNIVKTKVFHNADVFVEVHDFAGVCDEDQWRRHQAATAKGAVIADFGGGDRMTAKSKKKGNVSHELADRAESMSKTHAQKFAHEMGEEERARRIEIQLRADMQVEAERLVNQEIALEMAEKERNRRIAEDGRANVGSEESAIRHSMLMKEMFSANHMEKMDEIARTHARKLAKDMYDSAQSDKVKEWAAMEASAEKLREFARDKALAQMMDEQDRRINGNDDEHDRYKNAKRTSAHIEGDLAEAAANFERNHHKRGSLKAMDDEQERRTAEAGTSYKPKLNAKESRKRQSMHEEVVKVVKIINHQDRDGNMTTTTTTTETKFTPAARA